jgi:hypothetical protein
LTSLFASASCLLRSVDLTFRFGKLPADGWRREISPTSAHRNGRDREFALALGSRSERVGWSRSRERSLMMRSLRKVVAGKGQGRERAAVDR